MGETSHIIIEHPEKNSGNLDGIRMSKGDTSASGQQGERKKRRGKKPMEHRVRRAPFFVCSSGVEMPTDGGVAEER